MLCSRFLISPARQRFRWAFGTLQNLVKHRDAVFRHGAFGWVALPSLWLYTLGTFPTKENALFLGAVTDAEVLAVHSAVHDALAGKVRDPWAYYLPGAWVPHCALAQDLDPKQRDHIA